MGTLAKDAWLFVVVAVLSIASTYWLLDASVHDRFPSWLAAVENRDSVLRIASRGLGLAGMGVFYLRRGDVWRAAETFGGTPPSPWSAAIPALAVSFMLVATLAWLVTAQG
jgi:hypothetical protein